MRQSRGIWLWGQFSEEDTKYLVSLQRSVQSKLFGPHFDVHLTLLGPYSEIDKLFSEIFEADITKYSPIQLTLKNFEYEDQFYKSFFISIEDSNKLIKMRKDIHSKFPLKSNQIYKPHISLTYGNHCSQIKKELLSNLENPCKKIILNKISIVDVNEDNKSWKIKKTLLLK